MAGPPRDADGCVQPHDDSDAIPNDGHLVRYVTDNALTPNDNPEGTKRLSSGAFSSSSKEHDHYEGMSVDAYERMVQDGVDVASRMRSGQKGAVLLRAGDLRALGLQVGMDPKEDNPHHAAVWDVKNKHRKKIRKLAIWLIRPPDVDDDLPDHGTP